MRALPRGPLVALLCGVLCLALTACGSNSESNAPAGSALTAAQKAVVADAKTAFAKYTEIQPAAAVPALPAPAPTGKRLVLISCSLPVCATLADGAVVAAKKLGWNIQVLNSNSTPQGFLSVLDQVVANPPDGLIYIAVLPDSSIKSQLNKLHAAGTKLAVLAPQGVPMMPPVGGAVLGEKDASFTGNLMAQSVIADADGPADSVFVWDPSVKGAWGPIKDAYVQEMKAAGGNAGVLEVSNANIGKTVPSQIVSYLQAHPETKYVALCVVDYNAGLDSALAAAGLSGKVKIISRAADAASLKAIDAGTQWASIGLELAAAAYRSVDQIVRMIAGVPLGDRADAAGWQQIYTKDNITQTSANPEPPGYAKAYYAAWHVG